MMAPVAAWGRRKGQEGMVEGKEGLERGGRERGWEGKGGERKGGRRKEGGERK